MSETRFALWRSRILRLWLSGGASAVGAIGSIVRNKWLALHFDPAGMGVLGQVFASQTWLATATGAGLGLPVAQHVGAALGRGDLAAVRRTMSTALTLLAGSALAVSLAGLVAAPWISVALFGSAEHAALIRISMAAVAGLSFQGTIQGLFAGFSDVRATFVYAVAGNVTVVSLVLLTVPRFGLAGAVWSMAAFWPVAILVTLWLDRRTYGPALAPVPRPRVDRAEARAMLKVAGAALVLALLDQGTLLGLRAHYVRAHGLDANGLLQASLALAQQLGAVFYGYLGGYAFGKISGAGGLDGIAAYTRKQWTPIVGLAVVGFAAFMLLASPLLHLLYSSRFDPAGPMLGPMMLGEFAKVAAMTWALGALPLGGVRLWFPIGVAWSAGLAAGYGVATALALGTLTLPVAYACAGATQIAYTGIVMTRRGVALDPRGLAVGAIGWLALAMMALRHVRIGP